MATVLVTNYSIGFNLHCEGNHDMTLYVID